MSTIWKKDIATMLVVSKGSRHFGSSRSAESLKLKSLLNSAGTSPNAKKTGIQSDPQKLKGLRSELFDNGSGSLLSRLGSLENKVNGGRSRDGVNNTRKLDSFLKSLTESHDAKNESSKTGDTRFPNRYPSDSQSWKTNPFGTTFNRQENSRGTENVRQPKLEFKTGSRHNNTLNHLMRKNENRVPQKETVRSRTSSSSLDTLRLEAEKREAAKRAESAGPAFSSSSSSSSIEKRKVSEESLKLKEASKLLKLAHERIKAINPAGTIRVIRGSKDGGITTYDQVRKDLDFKMEGLIVRSVANIPNEEGAETRIAVVQVASLDEVIKASQEQAAEKVEEETQKPNAKSSEIKVVRVSWGISIPDLTVQKKKEILNFVNKNEKLDIDIAEKSKVQAPPVTDVTRLDNSTRVNDLSDLETLRRNKIVSELQSILEEQRASFKVHGNISDRLLIRVQPKENVQVVSNEMSKDEKRRLKELKKLERQEKIKAKTEAKQKAIEDARLAAGL